MPRPYSLNDITDLTASSSGTDILNGDNLAQMDEDSFVLVFAVRESVDVKLQVLAGSDEVYSLGGCSLMAAVGNAPSLQDDLICATVVRAGERLAIKCDNANVAAQEISVICKVIPESFAVTFPQLLNT